ncbi:SPOR domain-containing protein [Algivirga pacifica]|uniref:SPOR domain-containing protein n=1 Tax=Algivirga pacifica TaxID=1162670 RepID=A0ABP9D9F1_9BACT
MIAKYIKEALIKNGTVVVTGLGTFRSENTAADVSDSGNMITPPHTEVTFTEEQDILSPHNVAEYIVDNTGMALAEVRMEIDLFVNNLMQEVKMGGAGKVTGLGYFKAGIGGKLLFHQYNEENVSPDSFGLPKIQATPMIEPEMNTPQDEKPSSLVYADDDRDAFGEEENQQWMYWVGVPLVLIAVLTGYVFYVGTDAVVAMFEGSPQQEQVVQEELVSSGEEYTYEDATSEVDENTSYTETIVEESAENTEMNTEEPSVDEYESSVSSDQIAGNLVTGPSNRYYIIVSSFSTLNNAEVAQKKLVRDGYTDAKVISYRGKYRVSAGDFSDRNAASSRNKQLSFKGAWVWQY